MWLDFLSSFAQSFLNAVLPVIATLLGGLLIAWLTEKINKIKAGLSSEAQWAIEQAVKSAVLAAEQVHLKDALIEKKNYALESATAQLRAKGIKLDLKILSDLIEAAVMDEFNRQKDVKQLPSAIGFALPPSEPE